MSTLRMAVVTLLLSSALGCQGTETASLESDDQKASYAIGLDVGRNLTVVGDHLDVAALRVGIEDALADREQQVPQEELDRVMTALQETIQTEQQAEAEAEATSNRAEGEAYLAENGARDGVTTTASGLQYEVLREGEGAQPGPTDQVTIHYRGTLLDGSEFDSSYERDQPATFSVNGVIPGFAEGLQLMTLGSQYRFVIPGELAYGPAGSPPSIGPDATLVFEVELLEIP